METNRAAPTGSAAATAKKSRSVTTKKMSLQQQQFDEVIKMSSPELGAAIKTVTARIAHHLGNADTHDVEAKKERAAARDVFKKNIARIYEVKQRLRNPGYRVDIDGGKNRTPDENEKNFGAANWAAFVEKWVPYTLQHADRLLIAFARVNGLFTDEGENIDDHEAKEPEGPERPQPRRAQDPTAQKRYEFIAVAAMEIANRNPEGKAEKQILAAAEYSPSPLMPVPSDLFSEVLSFITYISCRVADATIRAEAKQLVNKLRLHRPAPVIATVPAELAEEEKRERDKRLAKMNGQPLGSAACNPPTEGTSEHVQRSGPTPPTVGRDLGGGVPPAQDPQSSPQTGLEEAVSGVGAEPPVTEVGGGMQPDAREARGNLTKELWESYTPEEKEAYRKTLFVQRKKTDPWPDDILENHPERLVVYYGLTGFPHYRLTTEEKKKELQTLINFDHAKLYENGVIRPTMHAQGLSWSYFPHSWGVRCNDMRTPEEVFNDPSLFMKAIRKRMKLVTRINDVEIRKALRTKSGAQGVSNFRPSAAAAIYHHFLPEQGGVVWDMSAGFGGRPLGAMACSRVRKYIGTDPSTLTMAGLREMKAKLLPMSEELWPERPKLEIELHQCGSEDFPPEPESVDLCFTSPPYFDCEKYADEPTQSYIKFPTPEKWMNGFMKQTLANCRRALKPDGHLVINIAGVKTYPELVTDFKQLAEDNGWEKTGEAGLQLFRMMGTRKREKGYEVMKTEPLLIFRKIVVHDELGDFVPAGVVPFAPVEAMVVPAN